MNFFTKLRPGQEPATPPRSSPAGNVRPGSAVSVVTAGNSKAPAGVDSKAARQSNGLKEFLWQLDGIGRGHLLDFGPARQSTLNFFIERGFKVYTDDLLTTWKNFLDGEGQREKQLVPGSDRSEMMPAARADRFLET